MKRRFSILIAAVALLAGHLASPGRSAAAANVVIAQPTETFIFMPVYIARGKGYFTDEGLDVEVVVAGGGAKAAAALIGGSAQFVAGAFAHVVKATAKGQRLVSVAGMMNQIPTNIMFGTAAAKRLHITPDMPLDRKIMAMKGLRIGVTSRGSMTDLLVRYLADKQGMNPDEDITIVPLGDGQPFLSAVQRGAVDAIAQTSPNLETIAARGLGKIFINVTKGEVPDIRGFMFSSINTTRKYMEGHPDIVLKVVKAIYRAERFMAANPKGTLETLRPFFPRTDASVLETSFDNMIPAFKSDPAILRSEFEKNLEFVNMENKIAGHKPVTVSYGDVVTNEFVEKAKRELGAK